MKDHRFNEATVELLAATTGLPTERLREVKVSHRRHNWLHAPWYPAANGGGALTIGDRIHVTGGHDPETIGTDRSRWLAWVLLMAHEVGHVRQADEFGPSAFSRARFVLWAARNYTVSFFKNGLAAHAKAPFEVEAERGRQRLRLLLELSGDCQPHHPVVDLLIRNDLSGMQTWLAANAARIAQSFERVPA